MTKRTFWKVSGLCAAIFSALLAAENHLVEKIDPAAAGYAPGTGHGLGFEIVREALGAFRYASIGTFEKAGFYRTYVWGDPARDLLGVILMQRNTGGYQADMADEVNVFMAMAAAAIAK